jgi:hypothetical protein
LAVILKHPLISLRDASTTKLGERVRYFVEVKRWKHRIGIEIINQVLGAMVDERPRFGWHAAMIVTVVGAKDLRKYTLEELRLKGVWIKDQSDLNRWLDGYKPASSGLWLPVGSSGKGGNEKGKKSRS